MSYLLPTYWCIGNEDNKLKVFVGAVKDNAKIGNRLHMAGYKKKGIGAPGAAWYIDSTGDCQD